jgi:hypothetical protein
MPILKILQGLTLIFDNGVLVAVRRRGVEYKVSEVPLLVELKSNLDKNSLSIIDLEQLINMYSPNVFFKTKGNMVILKRVNLE